MRLYHDQGLFKEPFGGPTPWHQDQYYWPFEDVPTITMWMPMVDVPAEVGSMTFASGSHLDRSLRGPGISDESQATFAEQLRQRPAAGHPRRDGGRRRHVPRRVDRALARGGNPTDTMRAVMTVIYVADGARVATELSVAQDFDRKVWLGGRKPGELVDHELNPRLWPI